MFTLLDYLIIQPLIILFDLIFSVTFSIIEDVVPSLLILSLIVNFLVLPLYKKADALQKESHEKAKSMEKWVSHIRKHFSGDKRFMILSAYYRIEGYNPISSLYDAIPLLLQVPFFIAAYRYVSTLQVLKGVEYGPIKDLLSPDGLLIISGVTINILPILMTLINCVSGYIYAKDYSFRQRLQIYSFALIFLVLLYNSPSGLVLYWTMNNIFSLCKNLYSRFIPENSVLLKVLGSFMIIPILLLGIINHRIDTEGDIMLTESIIIIIALYLLVIALKQKNNKLLTRIESKLSRSFTSDFKSLMYQIVLPAVSLAILLGFYIPSSVVESSPLEFVNSTTGTIRTELLLYPAAAYVGLLVIWGTVMIGSREGIVKDILISVLWGGLGIALFNQFIAPVSTGTLFSDLSFDGNIEISLKSKIINLIICVLVAAFMIFLSYRKASLGQKISVMISVSLLFLFAGNLFKINNEIKRYNQSNIEKSIDTPIVLSRTGENVIVFMLDRAIGGMTPYIFDEKPELMDSFDGFVYYPNTVSFGGKTNFGSPPLYGGYEYTPYEMNLRSDESLKDKHNEALLLMPVLFDNEGYRVTVCDPPYANYQEIPDLSIYDPYTNIRAFRLEGAYTDEFSRALKGNVYDRQKHNMFFYSFFRTVPMFMKSAVYDNGDYLTVNISNGYYPELLNSYSVLWKLCDITSIDDSEQSSFLLIQNSTTHSPIKLDPPDYEMTGIPYDESIEYIDRIHDGRVMRLDEYKQQQHYCINIASYELLAEWFDYLKANGVYDNTRIILVADHGYFLHQFDDLIHPDGLDVETLNPLLMVKDFDAHGPIVYDYTFMTNADVPTIAMQGVIDDPVNPFTGVPVDNSVKFEGPVIVTDSPNWFLGTRDGIRFDVDDEDWWLVHDDIYNMDNWTRMYGEVEG